MTRSITSLEGSLFEASVWTGQRFPRTTRSHRADSRPVGCSASRRPYPHQRSAGYHASPQASSARRVGPERCKSVCLLWISAFALAQSCRQGKNQLAMRLDCISLRMGVPHPLLHGNARSVEFGKGRPRGTNNTDCPGVTRCWMVELSIDRAPGVELQGSAFCAQEPNARRGLPG
jgi:hypothetical protein